MRGGRADEQRRDGERDQYEFRPHWPAPCALCDWNQVPHDGLWPLLTQRLTLPPRRTTMVPGWGLCENTQPLFKYDLVRRIFPTRQWALASACSAPLSATPSTRGTVHRPGVLMNTER